jgi:hypothetical protein
MIKPTKHTLKKLEALFEWIEYDVRYERGNFQSGYCIVQDKKVAVVNKYFDTPGRIDCLIDILLNLDIDENSFEDPKMTKFYKQILKNNDTEEEE